MSNVKNYFYAQRNTSETTSYKGKKANVFLWVGKKILAVLVTV